MRKILIAAAALTLAGTVTAPAAMAAPSAAPSKTYTMSQVAKHNKATDCWTTVGKSVYNVTRWVNKHPGGSGTITMMCGKDGTKLFAGQHGSSAAAKKALAGYKVGTLR